MTAWIRTTEVARLVRQHLVTSWDGKGKGNPDGWKYSVRSDSYSGGSAVRVTVPKDYPEETRHALALELMSWGSRGFDGMTDSSYGKGHTLCPDHGVTLTVVQAHWGTEEQTYTPCCSQAEPVHLGADYVNVYRDWQ
jgi:hypothetical protein